MPLRIEQSQFAKQAARLILKAYELGYEVTLAEAYRSPEEAERLFKAGRGILNSLHCSRLAIDLNLFKDGVYLRSSSDYAELGRWWKMQDPAHRWGGDFRKVDGNHFSRTWQGRA